MRNISDRLEPTAIEHPVSRVSKDRFRMAFHVKLEASYCNEFRNAFKVASVLEICKDAQNRNGFTTREDLRSHLDVNVLPKAGYMPG